MRIYPGGEGLQVFKGRIAGIPVEALYFFATVVVGQFILSWTRIGRAMTMVGSNARAATAAGISTAAAVTFAYVLAGACAAISGILLAARYGSGDMELGTGYDYTAIAAVLVGGTAIQGGSGSVVRTLIGVTVIAIIEVVLLLRGFSQQLQYLITGIIVLSVIMLHTHRREALMNAHFVKFLLSPTIRPFTIMACAIIVLGIMDRGHGYFFSVGTIFSVMQLFATIGLVALGLGLSMLVREFDLSVAGMVGLAGCIAVMTGVENPWLGVLLGVGAGVVSGVVQGLIMTRLGLSSVGVTLGGLLTLQGITYVLTENKTISYPNMAVALGLNEPIANLLSVRSVAVLAVFVLAAVVMTYHPYRPRRDRNRQRPAGQPDRRAQHRPRHHRRIRSIGRVGGLGRRAPELQPRRRLAGRTRRCAGARGGGGHRRRSLGGGRSRRADGNRGGRAHALCSSLGLKRHRRLAPCA